MPFGPKKVKVETEIKIFQSQRYNLFKIFVKLSLVYSEKWILSYQNNIVQTTWSELEPCIGGSAVWPTNTAPPLLFGYHARIDHSQAAGLARQTWWQLTSWLRTVSHNLQMDSKRVIWIPCANSKRLSTLEIAAAKFRSCRLLHNSLEISDILCQYRISWESVGPG